MVHALVLGLSKPRGTPLYSLPIKFPSSQIRQAHWNVVSGFENECHPSRERVSGCLKQAGTEAKKWMGGGGGSKPPDGDQQRGKVAKFGPSPFPIGLHYLSQNKDFSQPSTHTLNKFYAIWYLSKLVVLRDGEMDALKTWTLNVLSVPILAALGSAPCQPLEGGFTHISISMKRRLPLSPRLLPCLERVVCKKQMLFLDLEFVASLVTIFGFKIKNCFYVGRSPRIRTNQMHFGQWPMAT